ncbi:MAG: ABC transporter permease [Lentisphaeria bacterium]|nr:ABC transporter permease [Lentisphaeria bacterium]
MNFLSRAAWRRFASDIPAVIGTAGIGVLLLVALLAPFLANGRPLMAQEPDGTWCFPFWRTFFAPDSPEVLIEQVFNYSLLLLIVWGGLHFVPRAWRKILRTAAAVLLLLPFLLTDARLDKVDYRSKAYRFVLFAPIPYGPFELAGAPYEAPSGRHWCGLDDVGRDVASRLISGSRVSLAVGLGGALLALSIGTAVGLSAGFFRGWFDLTVMRIVEIVMCFPTFLLLLILMSILGDRKFEQSILIVIGVIGLTGWIGAAFLVRGETLRQRALPYIESGIVSGLPVRRILFFHLLPNISGPLLISFTFGAAGAILAESGLSFLGFGVRPPTASWGGLLRQAFDDPLSYWHLTLFPGLALFWSVLAFNFTGEGLRKAFSPK